ncbi:MAG: type II toxin-antitoxin system prevent-host-death family antitoxin [Deltaproteobacteria bacterium]|nr:type II toxin-antitoxin system prevent-host-death family antitoxin [Deltaproteobacteria bacterium]
MAKRMTTAQTRQQWAKVLRGAERGAAVEVTRHGQPIAAVVSIDDYRRIEDASKETLADVVAWFRAQVRPGDVEGADPWADVRDRSPGRKVDLDR